MESSFLGYFAHAGFLGALHAAGVRPSHLAGASSGSLIAVMAAAGFSTERIRSEIFDPAFRRSFWEWSSFSRMMGMLFWLRGATGFSSAAGARRHLERIFKDSAPNLEDCRHARISVAVANLTHNRTEILETGNTAEIIIASCAFPGLVCVQKIGSGHCLDGGVADSCPFVHYADCADVHTIITHHIEHVGHGDSWSTPGFIPRISDVLGRAHEIITHELHKMHVNRVLSANKILIPVTTAIKRPGPFTSYARLEACYESGWETGATFLAKHGASLGR
jgi:predicted acylesterase/phospholipase RssA